MYVNDAFIIMIGIWSNQ